MTWVVLSIIAGIVFWVGVAGVFIAQTEEGKGGMGALAGVTAVLWIVVSLFMSIHTVGQRQVGIVYNFSGTIQSKKDPGVVMTWPWQHIKRENVGIQRENFDLVLGDNSASTQDLQQISAHLTVNFQVQPGRVVNLYKQVGPSWKQILLDSRVLQDFKEVVSHYTAAQITTQRSALRADTKARLQRELNPYDVKVVDVFVTNLGYSNAYREAVDAKNVQVQQALQAQAKVAQSRAEADQEVAKAEGDKRAAIARAEGDAKANKLIANSISDRLIRLRQIEALQKANTIYVPANWTAFGNLGASK